MIECPAGYSCNPLVPATDIALVLIAFGVMIALMVLAIAFAERWLERR